MACQTNDKLGEGRSPEGAIAVSRQAIGGGPSGAAPSRRIKHGHAGRQERSGTYRTWSNIKVRCYNRKHHKYLGYGGRGIYVCDRWRTSFENFLEDMGERPSQQHTIERMDNDGPYSPENCIWILQNQQQKNTRRSVWITFRGETLCLAGWSQRLNISYNTLWSRFNTGWSIEKALTYPVRPGPSEGKEEMRQ